MSEPDYTKIIALLDAAKAVIATQVGNLTPADLRIRSLVDITGKEARRALLEAGAPPGSGAPLPENSSPRAVGIDGVPLRLGHRPGGA